MTTIHPTAVVHSTVELDEDVKIGPFCIVGEHVKIGRGTQLLSHVCVEGRTEIGQRCLLFPYVSVGSPPQHLQYRGEPTRVVIGDENILREYVTVNRGTAFGGGCTTVGHHNFLMAYVHIAHDCHVGNHVIMANAATLAGHITIGDYAVIGGLVGIHQYVRVGEYAMIGGCSAVGRDVPPYMRAAGYRARLYGVNTIGLRRGGFSAQRIRVLKQAYQVLFRKGMRLSEATKLARHQFQDSPDVLALLTFLESSTRGTCRAAGKGTEVDEEFE
ncbi:MAG: acyl-ACP--UDP-N-acetylglucosamine O-acyltransferase [Nitrospirae bacterium]|nr:MAG: acyl-ACP--UDP-N-acetylglucosamine O-acyltransferase [Nitrospirota bacterium]